MPEEPKATNGVAVSPTSALTREFGPEDWRRAQDALARALDPHGASSRVAWANPKTAMRGSFAPAGQPFVKSDEICRAFEATIDGQAPARRIEGTACRPSGGDWSIKTVRPLSRRA